MSGLAKVLNHIEALDLLEDLAAQVICTSVDIKLLKAANNVLKRIEEHDEALATDDNARELEHANDNDDDRFALASAGFGTDEDYGYYGEHE